MRIKPLTSTDLKFVQKKSFTLARIRTKQILGCPNKCYLRVGLEDHHI